MLLKQIRGINFDRVPNGICFYALHSVIIFTLLAQIALTVFFKQLSFNTLKNITERFLPLDNVHESKDLTCLPFADRTATNPFCAFKPFTECLKSLLLFFF